MQQSDKSMASRRRSHGSGGARLRRLFEQQQWQRQVGQRDRHVGRRRGEGLPGDGRAVGEARRATRSSTPAPATSTQILTTGVASGVLPDLAGLPGPGQMTEFAKAGALKPLDDVLDMADVQGGDRSGARRARHRRRQDRRRVHQGRGQGPDLVQPEAPRLLVGAARRRWDDLTSQAAANKGNAEATWCLGLESGAASGWPGTDWIEDIVLRPGRPGHVRPVVAGQAQVDLARDQDRVRDVRQGRSTDAYGGRAPS